MVHAYLNRIATAVPQHEVHGFFARFAAAQLSGDRRRRALFERMAEKGGIEQRFSCMAPSGDAQGPALDAAGLFRRECFPGTGARMDVYAAEAPQLAAAAVARLRLGSDAERITHLIVTSCTGFSAPGIDLAVIERCGLRSSIERTLIGFMGCYAAINALKLARHIVRSEPAAKVLIVNLELCTLHLKETEDLAELLTFLLWGDGCAASLVTAEPTGIRLEGFRAVVQPGTGALMSWAVRDQGFDMVLSGQVPATIHEILATHGGEILGGEPVEAVDLWAVHPGGRSVLDAVERALDLPAAALAASRDVLRRYGNMSSATVMFVLQVLLAGAAPDLLGCGMAFGPGLTAETMTFRTAGARG